MPRALARRHLRPVAGGRRAGGGLAGGRRAVPGPPPTPRGAGRRGRDRRGARDPGGGGLRLVSPLPSPPTAVTGERLGLVPHLPEGVRVGLGAGAKARGEASVLAAVPLRPPVCGLRGRVAGAGRPRGPWAGWGCGPGGTGTLPSPGPDSGRGRLPAATCSHFSTFPGRAALPHFPHRCQQLSVTGLQLRPPLSLFNILVVNLFFVLL